MDQKLAIPEDRCGSDAHDISASVWMCAFPLFRPGAGVKRDQDLLLSIFAIQINGAIQQQRRSATTVHRLKYRHRVTPKLFALKVVADHPKRSKIRDHPLPIGC